SLPGGAGTAALRTNLSAGARRAASAAVLGVALQIDADLIAAPGSDRVVRQAQRRPRTERVARRALTAAGLAGLSVEATLVTAAAVLGVAAEVDAGVATGGQGARACARSCLALGVAR